MDMYKKEVYQVEFGFVNSGKQCRLEEKYRVYSEDKNDLSGYSQ